MSDLPQLGLRAGLPENLLFLTRKHPRPTWPGNPGLGETGQIWLHNHGYFRMLAQEIAADLDALRIAGEATARTAPHFVRQANNLLGGLEGHHNIEDAHYFPRFRAAEPRLIRGFDIMDADHHVIHAAIHDFADAARVYLRALGDGQGALTSQTNFALDAMAATTAKFRRAMTQHLDDEEDLVIPLILERALADPEFG